MPCSPSSLHFFLWRMEVRLCISSSGQCGWDQGEASGPVEAFATAEHLDLVGTFGHPLNLGATEL